MESGGYKLDKGRVVVSTGGGCSLGCKYCYVYSEGYDKFPQRSVDQVVGDIRRFENRIDTVQLGVDTELFLDERNALDLVNGLSGLNKDISFATKMCLSDRAIQ